MTQPMVAWAIRAPDGRVFTNTVSNDEGTSKRRFLNECTLFYSVWRMAEEDGYRCVRVLITPVEAKER